MRTPISLAYLLARASDTIADTEGVEASHRLEALDLFVNALLGGDSSNLIEQLRNHFLPKVSHPKEQALLLQLDQIVENYFQLSDPLRQSVEKVVEIIISGQKSDVLRFEVEGRAVDTDEQLLNYCYRVAGCVGEFWTEVGLLTQPKFSKLDEISLRGLGRDYGIGLQIINVLRDAPKDLQQGRRYIPQMCTINKQLVEPWIHKAEEGMKAGQIYAKSLKGMRCRIATNLPSELGLETLKLLQNSSLDTWNSGLKVKRSRVYSAILKGIW